MRRFSQVSGPQLVAVGVPVRDTLITNTSDDPAICRGPRIDSRLAMPLFAYSSAAQSEVHFRLEARIGWQAYRVLAHRRGGSVMVMVAVLSLAAGRIMA